jgi:hypothetical protein
MDVLARTPISEYSMQTNLKFIKCPIVYLLKMDDVKWIEILFNMD